MHISLDAALQRQPLLSTVGDKLLPSFPGAAAAYSLRPLNGDGNDVIRVRRDGDSDGITNERDFTGIEVNTELEDWVNGKLETKLPADVDTAAAAFSLRKVRSTYPGDAVRIRRASDDVEVEVAFDANGAVSASSGITNVEDISLISESGFATDTGGFESSISGANFSFGNTLDGRSNVLFATFDGSGLLGLNFLTSDLAIGDVVTYSFDVYWKSTNIGELPDLRIRSGVTPIGHTDVPMPSKDSWYTFSGQFTVTSNTPTGLTLIAQNSSGLTTGDIFAIANGSYSKQQDAGDTTATTLGGFLTEGGNQDAYVQTWYDQSGNNYHLTQDTAGSQPKIADNGALLTLAGKPTIRPDGSSDFLINENAIWDTISNTNLSCMAVSEKTSVVNKVLWAIGSSSAEDGDWLIGGGSVAGNVQFRGGRINSAVSSIGTSGAVLLTALDVAGGDGFVDGTAIGSPSSVSPNVTADRLVLFTRRGTSSLGTCTDQDISEIIFYNSDQSTNRFKIESNINNHYGLSNAALAGDFTASGAESFTADGTNGFTLTNSTSTAFAGIELEQALAAGDKIYVSFNLRIDAGANTSPNLTVREGSITGTSAIEEPFFIPSEGVNSTSFTSDSGGDAQYITFGENDIDPSTYTISNFRVSKFPFNDGFVETWYDQSGNGNHAVQDFEAEQPKIVSAGSFVADGIEFDGSQSFNLPTDIISSIDSVSSFLVAQLDNTAGTRIALALSRNNPDKRYYLPALISGVFDFGYGTTASAISLGTADTNKHLFSATSGASTTEAFLDGTSKGTVSSTSGLNTLTSGGISEINSALYWSGTMNEIIVYASDQSANRTGIESNIADEYGITLS